jgi:hypothetical protein
MHRPFAFSLAIPFIACAWMNQAVAQEAAAYGDPDAPYDDYDADQPYDDEQYDEQVGGSVEPSEPMDGSIDTFHAELEPYGRWVASQEYGLIWVPSRAVVGPSFAPYSTGGSWQYTNVGWMFASDWRWGWATFHYGRWYRDPVHGWCWVPGSVWAPAWVDWRFGHGVVGWAPLPPRHQRTVWMFAGAGHMNRQHIDRYVYRDSSRYYRTTTPVRHRFRSGRAYWYSGPRRDQIEREGRIQIRPVRMQPPRAGVVVRVRLEAGRVHTERVAAPRDRVITRSRREAFRARPATRQPSRSEPGRAPGAVRRDAPGPRAHATPPVKKPDPDERRGERDRQPGRH